jgi:hypothetical protein
VLLSLDFLYTPSDDVDARAHAADHLAQRGWR